MDPPAAADSSQEHGKWRTVQFALASWPRTIRLCLIVLTFSAPFDAALLMVLR
jgi:hypothetical protein